MIEIAFGLHFTNANRRFSTLPNAHTSYIQYSGSWDSINLAKTISEDLYERAVKVIPGGVTRPLRYIAPYPFYAEKAQGSKLVGIFGPKMKVQHLEQI